MDKILIIDDNADICYTVSEICAFAGWQAMTAENGQDGLEKLVEYKPDLIIIDYHMPVMDGIQTVKIIRKTLNVPIIVLTVDERQELADEFLIAGATDFALKPIKAPDLISRIKVNLRIGEFLKGKAKNEEIYTTKGINIGTLKLITDCMQREKVALTLDDITGQVGLAYQTVHRYMLYLISEGKISTDTDYGKIGRPKNKYTYIA